MLYTQIYYRSDRTPLRQLFYWCIVVHKCCSALITTMYTKKDRESEYEETISFSPLKTTGRYTLARTQEHRNNNSDNNNTHLTHSNGYM